MPYMISGSSKASSCTSMGGVLILLFFGFVAPTSAGFCFLFVTGEVLEIGRMQLPISTSSSRMIGEGSLLSSREVFVPTTLELDARGSLPDLEEGLGIDWQSKVARLTPVDSRSDLAFGRKGE